MKQSPSKSALNQSSLSNASLARFDFSTLEENDPVLEQGFVPIFDQEISFRIRLTEKETEFPTEEVLRVRILVQKGNDKNLEVMKLELSSDNDLFFHFLHRADADSYEKQIQPEQQLYCKFIDYPAVCIKNFDKCAKESQQFVAILTIKPDGQGRVEIVQLTEYRSIEMISFDLNSSDEETIRSVISFKYLNVKQKLNQMESKLKDINDVVKIKNPSLLLQIQKSRMTRQK